MCRMIMKILNKLNNKLIPNLKKLLTQNRKVKYQNIQYLVKKSNNDYRKGSKDDIIERLEPIVIEPLARKSSLEGEPKLSECEC